MKEEEIRGRVYATLCLLLPSLSLSSELHSSLKAERSPVSPAGGSGWLLLSQSTFPIDIVKIVSITFPSMKKVSFARGRNYREKIQILKIFSKADYLFPFVYRSEIPRKRNNNNNNNFLSIESAEKQSSLKLDVLLMFEKIIFSL